MIKASELRIGNYIKKWVADSQVILPVESSDFADIDKLETSSPISLNKDWLYKFGWVWNEECKSYEKYPNGDARMNMSPSILGYTMYNYVLKSITCTKIKHVHELQNIYFSLTGKELEPM